MKLFVNKPMDQTPFDKARVWCRKHPKTSFAGIEILFVLLALISYHGFLLHGTMQWSNDSIFHWQRLDELAQDIKHGIWPQFDTFIQYRGSALMTFYPWATWLPFALLRLMNVPPVIIIGLYPIIVMILGLNISYFAFHTLQHSHMWALFYALLYNITFIDMTMWIIQGEYAQYLSYAFAPLAFIGWLHWLKSGHYKMMTTGLILMMFTHLISTLILMIGLAILTLFFYQKITKRKIVQGIKAGSIFVLSTAAVWLPICVLMGYNSIWHPELKQPMVMNADLIPYSISTFSGGLQDVYDLTIIMAIFIGAFKWKQIGYYCRRFYVMMWLMLLCNAPFLPWNAIQKTVVKIIQFPYRTNLIIRLCAAMITVKGLQLHFDEPNKDRIARTMCVVWVLVVSCFLSVSLQNLSLAVSKNIHMSLNNISGMPSKIYHSHGAKRIKMINLYKHNKGYKHSSDKILLINKGYPVITSRQFNSSKLLNYDGQLDYIPKTYIKSIEGGVNMLKPPKHHKALKIKGQWNSNGILHFHTFKNYHKIRLPIVLYKGQKYDYWINHKLVRLKSHKDEPVLKNVHHGYYTFKYRTPMMWYRWFGLLLTTIGLIILVSSKKYRRMTKKMSNNRI